MLSEVCAYLRNYFDNGQPHTFGEIEIKNGALFTPCDLKAGQYFRIIGSTFNDGVYQFPTTALNNDEIFNGAVWGMAVPPDLIALIAEMEAWKTNNAYALNTPYQSESKADYSYSLKSSGNSADGGAMTVINQFSGRLARWRKL